MTAAATDDHEAGMTQPPPKEAALADAWEQALAVPDLEDDYDSQASDRG